MTTRPGYYGAVEFDPVSGETGDIRVFDTLEDRRAWVAERPDARAARTGETARWLIERRAMGLAPRSVFGEKVQYWDEPVAAPIEELTREEWTKLTESVGILHSTVSRYLGEDHRDVQLLNLALRYVFEAVEARYDARQAVRERLGL